MRSTRRDFLKTAAVVSGVIPFGATLGRISSPNERIRVGFIGTGSQARGLLAAFMSRCQVLAVCDVDATRREDFRNRVHEYYTRYPEQGTADCKTYTDFEQLLAQDNIDAVCIATPDHWHAAITLAALRAGKDVYCEKPLTHDIAEAVEVMAEVDRQGRVLQTGSMQRSAWEFRLACELARNGVIGKISRIECNIGDPGVPCDLPGEEVEPNLDWNLWVGPAPMRPYHSKLCPRGVHDFWPGWRDYKEYGGGGVCDWGAHHLDIAQWALGMDDSGPVKIVPPADRSAKRGVKLIYADGAEVVHKDGLGVHMFGSDGEIQVYREKFWFTLGDKTIAKYTQREDGGSLESKLNQVEKEYLKDAKVRLYKVKDGHVGDFVQCVKTRKKPITNEVVGARSAICCHLMNLAYWHGQTIGWNPQTNTFVEGAGDPAWLKGSRRDYRKA